MFDLTKYLSGVLVVLLGWYGALDTTRVENARFDLYRANVESSYDGDTVHMDANLGLHTTRQVTIRLLGINAPELRGDQRELGIASRDHLRELMARYDQIPGGDIQLVLQIPNNSKDDSRRGKYGRYLGILWGKDEMGRPINLNDRMIEDGHAKRAFE